MSLVCTNSGTPWIIHHANSEPSIIIQEGGKNLKFYLVKFIKLKICNMYITFYLFSEIVWSPLARMHLTSQENSEIHLYTFCSNKSNWTKVNWMYVKANWTRGLTRGNKAANSVAACEAGAVRPTTGAPASALTTSRGQVITLHSWPSVHIWFVSFGIIDQWSGAGNLNIVLTTNSILHVVQNRF